MQLEVAEELIINRESDGSINIKTITILLMQRPHPASTPIQYAPYVIEQDAQDGRDHVNPGDFNLNQHKTIRNRWLFDE